MAGMGPVPSVDRRRLSPWPHVIWVVVVGAVVTTVLVVVAGTDRPEGQCDGIGWGCTMSGEDVAGFVALLIVPPAAVVLAVGHLVIWIVARRVGPRPRGSSNGSSRRWARDDRAR